MLPPRTSSGGGAATGGSLQVLGLERAFSACAAVLLLVSTTGTCSSCGLLAQSTGSSGYNVTVTLHGRLGTATT